MSATPCADCSRPVADGYLCHDCAGELRDVLYGVRALVEDLEISLCRQARIGSDGAGIRARGAEIPLVFNWAAAEALWQLHNTLTGWAATIAEGHGATVVIDAPLVLVDPHDPARIFPRRGRIVGSATWLAERIDWVRAHTDASGLSDQVRYAITTGSRAIDRPPDRAYAGPCGEDTEDGPCPADLYAPPRAVKVKCRGCGATHDMAARRDWLLSAAEDLLVTAPEASRALPGLLDQPVTAAMIRGHAHRGKLAQHPPHPGSAPASNGQRLPLYRLGDIVDVLLAAEAEKTTKTKRSE